MIVKMKKLYLLCMKEHSEEALDIMADLGVMHIESLSPEESEETSLRRTALDDAKTALSSVSALKSEAGDAGSLLLTSARAEDGAELVEKILKVDARIRELHDRIAECEAEKARVAPFGQFEPESVRDLQKKGLTVKLFSLPIKEEPDADFPLFELSSGAGHKYYCGISKGDFNLERAEEHPIPARSLGAVLLEIESCKAEIDAAAAELNGAAREKAVIDRHIVGLEEDLMFAEARDALGADGAVAYLQGFCPEDAADKVMATAKEHGWGIMLKEPEEEADPPTLIRYPGIVKPIKAVFDMIQIFPGYREADISSIFLVFFSIFFAMLIGDAGYGLLFLVMTIIARLKMRKAPAYPFALFGLLSVCTMIWGVLTANYFGIDPKHLPTLMSETLRVEWLGTDAHVMKLCFLIGAIHLTLAHIWNAVVLFPNKKWLAQLGWICLVWTMFLTAIKMVLNNPVPTSLMGGLAIAGAVLVALFMSTLAEFKKEWIHHAMLPLDFIACFVDVMSYVRLFAVGLASLYVARSFNDMAIDAGAGKMILIPVTALILLIGHGLNIALCALGILVHGIRLNTLEFSLHKDMQWSGKPFKPFSKNKIT